MLGRKRPSDLTVGDLEDICKAGLPESDIVEFKGQFPNKRGAGRDSWREDRTFSDRARNEILEELVGFANASGGWLLIGIEETDTKPGKAKSIAPLPDCSDLADRLAKACRDCIEPQLPFFEIHGLPTGDGDDGVVAAYIAKSRAVLAQPCTAMSGVGTAARR